MELCAVSTVNLPFSEVFDCLNVAFLRIYTGKTDVTNFKYVIHRLFFIRTF